MRVVMPVLLLLAVGLSGCAGYELDGLVPPPETGGQNATAEPDPVPAEHVPVEQAAGYPVVPAIATAAFTAPVPMELARADEDHAVLSLLADERGLRCVSQVLRDPMSAPGGYRVERTWARCELAVGNTTHVQTAADTAAADMPLLAGIPVEAFTWSMEVGRVLVNNTGEHEEVLVEVAQDVSAAPSVHMHAPYHYGAFFSGDAVCDTPMGDAVATLRFTSEAHNGLALLAVDLEGYDVLDIRTSAGSLSENRTPGSAWLEDATLRVAGLWEHESSAWADVTIQFRGREGWLALLPPFECPDALYVDPQEIPAQATATGIAAGWEAHEDWAAFVEVWHTL